ncbi:MAG: hypothetical protein EBS56_08760, partial [Planctomycetia bacterium]|nr:hypothetical protein [Planctomycetia bacterium]
MMSPTDVLLMVQAVASGAMCGIIWFVQVVHYPLFAWSGGDERRFAEENQRRTGGVVIPFMLAEGATAGLFAWMPPAGVPQTAAVVGVVIVAMLWLSTAM